MIYSAKISKFLLFEFDIFQTFVAVRVECSPLGKSGAPYRPCDFLTYMCTLQNDAFLFFSIAVMYSNELILYTELGKNTAKTTKNTLTNKFQTWSSLANASKQGLGTKSLTYSNGFWTIISSGS